MTQLVGNKNGMLSNLLYRETCGLLIVVEKLKRSQFCGSNSCITVANFPHLDLQYARLRVSFARTVLALSVLWSVVHTGLFLRRLKAPQVRT